LGDTKGRARRYKKADDEIMNDKFAHVNEEPRNINLKEIFVKRYEKKRVFSLNKIEVKLCLYLRYLIHLKRLFCKKISSIHKTLQS
jgi:hypothetical protein